MTPRKTNPDTPKRPRSRPTLYGDKLVQTALWLKREQLDGLKDQAKRRGITASQLLRELIDRYLGVDEMENDKKVVELVNPFSGVVAKEMTVSEIKQWCADNVHKNDQAAWMTEARKAIKQDDGNTLGTMIIGA